jgi:hypothetical protein
MWPFKKKTKYVRSKRDGVVGLIMYDHVIVDEDLYYMRVMLVSKGQAVAKGQILGKK